MSETGFSKIEIFKGEDFRVVCDFWAYLFCCLLVVGTLTYFTPKDIGDNTIIKPDVMETLIQLLVGSIGYSFAWWVGAKKGWSYFRVCYVGAFSYSFITFLVKSIEKGMGFRVENDWYYLIPIMALVCVGVVLFMAIPIMVLSYPVQYFLFKFRKQD